MNEVVSLVTIGGAAGVAIYVLRLIVEGKLHTHSEVDGLRRDKADLQASNKVLSDALAASNKMLLSVVRILRRIDDVHINAMLDALTEGDDDAPVR